MSSSISEDQTEISIDVPREDIPHGGKKIHSYVLSPNKKCIATLSKEDISIVVWSITDELIVNYDSSLNVKLALNTDKFCKKQDFNYENTFEDVLYDVLLGISNCKQVIIRLSYKDFVIDFAIIDIRTKLRQILIAQGLEGLEVHAGVAFLENDDLVIITRQPIYRAYIFSKSNINGKQKWTCKNSIELAKNSTSCHISKKGKLFLCIDEIMPVVMQWDLITRKFDMQYILDLNLRILTMKMELNSDNTLLAIGSHKWANCYILGFVVCVYLTKSGMMIAKKIFDEELHFCFIGSREEERLFFSSLHPLTNYNSYIVNLRTHSLDKSPDTRVLHDIYHVAFNDKTIGPINIIDYSIISDYIIKTDNNYLLIQKLSQNKIWIEYLKLKEDYYGNAYTYFNIKEIMEFIQDILDKYNDKEYKPVRILAQDFSNERELCGASHITLGYGSILEIKVLENGDILLVCQLSILIYTIEHFEEDFKIKLIYCWSDELENENEFEVHKLPEHSLINLLNLFKNNLIFYDFGFEILPSPITLAFTFKGINMAAGQLLDVKHSALLKLYGKNIFKSLLKYNTDGSKPINELLDYCYDHSQSMLEKGDIYSFILIINQIVFILTTLEKSNKNIRFTEEFLSKTNMSIGINPDYYNNNQDLLSFNLQHYGNYIDLHDLSNTSFFNYFVFWISKKYNLLKKSYPQVYKILTFPYLLYSSYITIYPQETVLLIFPLLNFATYSKNYSYNELFYLQGNPFTSLLDASDYYKCPWNWFDLAAILVPTITSLIWLHDKTPSTWIITIAAFLLEIKFLLFFRTLDYFGTYFAIMIGVAQKVFSFLVVLGIIVLDFAHSLHLLLRPTSEYSYDQPSFTDDANNPWNLVSTYQFISSNGTVGKSTLIETPDDSTNLFTMFSTSVLAVYFMLTGDLSYVSSWVLKNNWTLAFLLVIFSFFTTVYLLNLFISLLGNAIDDKNNEESFLQLRGEILSEIELFWMLPYQRRKTNWFPEILWYRASVKELKKYIESVDDKKTLDPRILELTKTENSEENLRKLIDETLTNKINNLEFTKTEDLEKLKHQIDETLANKIDNGLKEPLDKINKLIELIEKKE
ncbi:transient receptor potential cation channel subfamily a member 1-like [Gigaspora margarita]|uniref:Transient receptor potential cation channel subfamily a member 1-like n=1 Tax=Gigaspora margarita TaxID=4874 RepID=A0A8H4AV78_GIGMA|nr:transient receptor potential cation channel subfamily a member 1-like [Gigaspora margarita]